MAGEVVVEVASKTVTWPEYVGQDRDDDLLPEDPVLEVCSVHLQLPVYCVHCAVYSVQCTV